MPGVFNATSNGTDADPNCVSPDSLAQVKLLKQRKEAVKLATVSPTRTEPSKLGPLLWHKPSPAFSDKQRQVRRRSSLCISESATDLMQDKTSTPTKPHNQRPNFNVCHSCRDHIMNNHPLTPAPLSHSPPHAFPPRRRSSYDTTHLVGSYEECLLTGRMSAPSSLPVPFHVKLGALGSGDHCPAKLKFPKHLSMEFNAVFYDHDLHETGTHGRGSPYVGVIDLESHYTATRDATKAHKFPGYRLPRKGQIQLVISNLQKTAVKLFLVPYDMSSLKPGQKTFIRQKVHVQEENCNKALFQAVHFQIACPAKGRYYLYGDLRLVFQNRASLADASSLVASSSAASKTATYLGISPNRDRLKVETVSGGYSRLKYEPTQLTPPIESANEEKQLGVDTSVGAVDDTITTCASPLSSTPTEPAAGSCFRCQNELVEPKTPAPSMDKSQSEPGPPRLGFQTREELKAQMLTDLKASTLGPARP